MRLDFLLREKPVRLLLALRTSNAPNTLSGLAKSAGMSFVHASHLVDLFSEEGLVTATKVGREKQVVLTAKGADVAQALETLITHLSKTSETPQPPRTQEAPTQSAEPGEIAFPEPPPQEKTA